MSANKKMMHLFLMAIAAVLTVGLWGCAQPNDEYVGNAPNSCLEALDEAENMFGITSDFITTVSPLTTMVGDAMQAGMDYDVATAEQINADMMSMNAEIADETEAMSEHKKNYNKLADACRNGE